MVMVPMGMIVIVMMVAGRHGAGLPANRACAK
jgi:hypothetical protein